MSSWTTTMQTHSVLFGIFFQHLLYARHFLDTWNMAMNKKKVCSKHKKIRMERVFWCVVGCGALGNSTKIDKCVRGWYLWWRKVRQGRTGSSWWAVFLEKPFVSRPKGGREQPCGRPGKGILGGGNSQCGSQRRTMWETAKEKCGQHAGCEDGDAGGKEMREQQGQGMQGPKSELR